MATALLREGASNYCHSNGKATVASPSTEWMTSKTLVIDGCWELIKKPQQGHVPNISDWQVKLKERGGVSWWRAQSTRCVG